MAPAALSIVTVTFTEPKERAKAFGVFGALAGGGAAIGLIVGGVLTEYASWRWCLGVNVPVALIVAALAAIPLVHESKAHGDTRYDVPGVAARDDRAVLAGLRLHRGRPAEEPRRPAATPRCRAGATRRTLTFLVARGGAAGRVRALGAPGHATRCCRCASSSTATAAGPTWCSCSSGAGLFAMFLFLTYYFQVNLGYSPLKAGFAFLPFSVGIILDRRRRGPAAAPGRARGRSCCPAW